MIGRKKALFVTFNDIKNPSFGGSHCSLQNYLALKKYIDVDVFTISKKSNLKSLKSILSFFYPPISQETLSEVKGLLEKNNYDVLYFDSSLCGSLIKYFKKKFNVTIIVFFHNVEVDYNNVRFGSSLLKYPYWLLAKVSEKNTVKYADFLLCLSDRDNLRIEELYGKKCDYIFPMTFEDKVKENKIQLDFYKDFRNEAMCLFVGSFIKPNYDGIRWFVDNVLDKIDANLIIVGKNFECAKDELKHPKVKIIGTVDDIGEHYIMADFVVSPIFSGGGMKAKVAEALMYGKSVFGTTESFSGYDVDYNKVGAECNSSTQFIEAIQKYIKLGKTFNENSREVFLEKYSSEALINGYRFIETIN